jgi:hypothetical protein
VHLGRWCSGLREQAYSSDRRGWGLVGGHHGVGGVGFRLRSPRRISVSSRWGIPRPKGAKGALIHHEGAGVWMISASSTSGTALIDGE